MDALSVGIMCFAGVIWWDKKSYIETAVHMPQGSKVGGCSWPASPCRAAEKPHDQGV